MAADSKKLKYTRDEIDSLLDQVQTNHADIVNNRTAAEAAEANSKLRDGTLQDNIDAEFNRATNRENEIELKFDKAIEEIDARSDVVDVVGTKASLDAYDEKITAGDVVKVLRDETQNDMTTYYRVESGSKKGVKKDWAFVGAVDGYAMQKDLEAEISNRTAEVAATNKALSDTAASLSAAVAAAETNRANGDIAEANARASAISSLQSSLTSKIDADVADERTARIDSDADLSNRITAEVNRASDSESKIDQNLNSEINRAKDAEAEIESDYMKKNRDEADITGKKTFKGGIEVAESTSKGDEFLFSGIKEASSDKYRPIWFAFYDGSSVVNGTPTYDLDFKYNPSSVTLSVGQISLAGGTAGKITAKDAALSGAASAKDLTVSGSAAVSGAAKVDGLSTLHQVSISPTNSDGAWYSEGDYGIDLKNSDLINANSIYTCDVANNTAEGIRFYRDGTSWDTLTSASGVLYYMPNDPLTGSQLKSANVVLHSGNYSDQIKKVALSEASTASYSIDSSSDSKTIATKGYAEGYADGLMSALNIESGTGAGSLQTKSGSNSATAANSFAGGKSSAASHAGAFA